MFTRLHRIVGVPTSTIIALALLSVTVAHADVAVSPTMLGARCPTLARAWGMGGASTALTQGPHGLLPNPAAAAPTQKAEAIIGYVDADLVAALLIYDPPAAADPFPAEPIIVSSPSEQQPEEMCELWVPVSAGLEQLPCSDGLRLGFARQCRPESQWSWGIAAEAAPQINARFFSLGLLHRAKHGGQATFAFSLGLNCDHMLVTGGAALDTASLGAAYEGRHWTLALDLFTMAGAPEQQKEALMGVEYRFGSGFALRAGSAQGNPTCGIGYRKSLWSVDVARLTMNHGQVFFPGAALRSADDLTVVSLTYGR